ncbi:M23 family metallopeptidase [Clostridiaceae bacterium Marseille-Q4145]|nr:M23 family metallopeptidase [Clostridiaceae bacterium Marseille-Q4145]
MNPFRQMACLGLLILLLCCGIQFEREWMDDGEPEQTALEQYQTQVETVWKELVYFPVPESSVNQKAVIRFENTWQTERHYGGKRKHEGIDLMAEPDKSGYFPVLSMTDGTIEQVGWLEKGGWRIGIRSIGGNYYYYAHFHSYIKDWKRGDPVKAGDLLGYMGDSGYGPEGTTGQFPVHLHLGIYLPAAGKGEQAINPYWMLRYLENKRLSYIY